MRNVTKVSVIVPAYNTEKYLPRCLDSIVSQTFTEWEALCVNDGSTDGSLEIFKTYAARDSRFRIIDKPHEGLSEARNAGIKAAAGDFIMFVDSDDFIHKQTLELAVGLQRRTGTDIVSWVLDGKYRKEALKIMRKGQDAIDFRPESFYREYDIDTVRYHVTHDIVSHLTEDGHTRIKWPLKFFFVVRYIFRKEIIADTPFLKGVIFEDFPWCSDMILKTPSVTITYLPLYFYYPNPRSIDNGSSLICKTKAWMQNLEYCMKRYRECADSHQMMMWSRLCKWPVIIGQIGHTLKLVNYSSKDYYEYRDILIRLKELGTFDDPQEMRHRKYKQKISNFINGKSLSDDLFKSMFFYA